MSLNGGNDVHWSADGQELFYRTSDSMMVARRGPGPAFSIVSRQARFSLARYHLTPTRAAR